MMFTEHLVQPPDFPLVLFFVLTVVLVIMSWSILDAVNGSRGLVGAGPGVENVNNYTEET